MTSPRPSPKDTSSHVSPVPCRNPTCGRQVRLGAWYCCFPCEMEHVAKWDVDGMHSAGCDERAATGWPLELRRDQAELRRVELVMVVPSGEPTDD